MTGDEDGPAPSVGHELANALQAGVLYTDVIQLRLSAAFTRIARGVKLLEAQVEVETLARLTAEAERDDARRLVCRFEGLDIVGQRHPGPMLARKGELQAAKARGWLYLYETDGP